MHFPEEFLEFVTYFAHLKLCFEISRYDQQMAELDSKFGCFYKCHQSAGPSEWDTCEAKYELF